jgi:threonine synthase
MCGTGFPAEALFVCDQCLGPLEVTYDYEAIGRAVTREQVSARPENLWRYLELLPVNEPRTGFYSGFTPLIKADRLARRLGIRELFIKDDSVNHPTFSYKDRVVSVRPPARSSSGSMCSPAHQPATWPTASRRTQRVLVSPATSSSPTTSKPRR